MEEQTTKNIPPIDPIKQSTKYRIDPLKEEEDRLSFFISNIQHNWRNGQLAIDLIRLRINTEELLIEELTKITLQAKQEQLLKQEQLEKDETTKR